MIFSANIFKMIVRERRVADRGRAASRALRNCGLCNTASGEILALAEGAVVLESVNAEEGNAEHLISGTGERVNCQAAALCGQAVYGSCRGCLRSLGGKKNGEVR